MVFRGNGGSNINFDFVLRSVALERSVAFYIYIYIYKGNKIGLSKFGCPQKMSWH